MLNRKALAVGLSVAACAGTTWSQDLKLPPPIWSTKPDVAAFEAMEKGHIAAAQQAVEQLVALKGARTIDNTLVPFDKAVQELDTANNVGNLMQNLHPDAALRDRATEMYRRASAAQTALSLNKDVYNALAALNLAGTDAATRYY